MASTSLARLSRSKKLLLGALAVADLGLLGAAHRDISRRDASELRGSKATWRAISLISFVGPIWYFARGRR